MESTNSTLNDDIVIQMLDLLENAHPKTLLNLALTSKSVYSLAERFLYRTLRLDFRSFTTGRLLECPKLYKNVKTIDFRGPSTASYNEKTYDKIVDVLAIFILKCHKLRRLMWGPRVPPTRPILEAMIVSNPHGHLYYEILGVYDTYVTLSHLRYNSTLVSLAVTLSGGHFEAFAELQVVTHSCRNLHTLSITMLPSHIDESWPQWQERWTKPLHLSTLQLSGFCPGVTGKSSLAAMTDLSELKCLWIENVPFVPVLSCVNLKSLRIALNGEALDDVVESQNKQLSGFLYQCDVLEQLSITGLTACMDAQLLRHLGRSLSVLRLHEYETCSGLPRRSVLSEEQIVALGLHCVRLQVLGIDINYQDEWPYELFDCIARSLWFIIELELYLEINMGDPNHPIRPAATLDSAHSLWAYLWSGMRQIRNANPSVCLAPRLHRLTVMAGSFRKYLLFKPEYAWEESQQQRFCVEAVENEEGRREGVAKTTCLEVEDLKREKFRGFRLDYAIRRANHGPSNAPEPDYFSLALEHAANAPTLGD